MGECECRCLNTSSTRSRWPSAAVKQTSKRNRSSYRYVNPLLLFLCRNFRHFPRFQSPRPLLAPKKKKKGGGEGERVSCDLCSSLHNTQNAVSRTCSAKTSPSSTMINVFPAESTRSASIWSSRVSTPSTGVTTVRIAGIVTVMCIAVSKQNAAI